MLFWLKIKLKVINLAKKKRKLLKVNLHFFKWFISENSGDSELEDPHFTKEDEDDTDSDDDNINSFIGKKDK